MSIAGYKAQNHPQQTGKRGAKDDVDDRATEQAFVDSLGPFDLDVAAAAHNAKCATYYTREDDGLLQPWHGSVWCNPPYSDLRSWVQKAWDEWRRCEPIWRWNNKELDRLERIVMLVPANRTEQGWWQDLVEPRRDRPGSPLHVRFLRGRMRFDRPNAVIGPKGDRPPFGCCLLTWGARP